MIANTLRTRLDHATTYTRGNKKYTKFRPAHCHYGAACLTIVDRPKDRNRNAGTLSCRLDMLDTTKTTKKDKHNHMVPALLTGPFNLVTLVFIPFTSVDYNPQFSSSCPSPSRPSFLSLASADACTLRTSTKKGRIFYLPCCHNVPMAVARRAPRGVQVK